MNEKHQISEYIFKLAQALGGVSNIVLMSNSASMLRYDIKNKNIVNVKQIKNLGAKTINFIGNNHIQIELGTQAESINIEMNNSKQFLLKNEQNSINIQQKSQNIANLNDVQNVVFCNNIIYSPSKGKTIELQNINDMIFAKNKLGKGYAIDVESYKTISIYAPVSGTIEIVYPTKHAYGIRTKFGNEILVHIGINTSRLNGVGFKTFVSQGQEVNKGDKLAWVDLQKIRNQKDPEISLLIIVTHLHGFKDNQQTKLINEILTSHGIPWFMI